MPGPGIFYNILQMDQENYLPVHANSKERGDDECGRQRCGCLRTSQKLRQILGTFPAPPPPTPAPALLANSLHPPAMARKYLENSECISTFCKQPYHPIPVYREDGESTMTHHVENTSNSSRSEQTQSTKAWRLVLELVQLVQLTVTASALALYYLIYCYMQLVYYTLRSALYFHNADGPMKITIGVVSATSLVIAFNLVLRVQRAITGFC